MVLPPSHPNISIRSPLTRGDFPHSPQFVVRHDFNPLPSHEGRPWRRSARRSSTHFNPLPSHEGRRLTLVRRRQAHHFNPLPSHEGRQAKWRAKCGQKEFQSAPLSRGETTGRRTKRVDICISIRSPLTRGDRVGHDARAARREFQSAPLSRGETRSPPIGGD